VLYLNKLHESSYEVRLKETAILNLEETDVVILLQYVKAVKRSKLLHLPSELIFKRNYEILRVTAKL